MLEVAAHADALQAAIDAGGPWLDPAATQLARETIERSRERLRLGVGHTVVALVGATGSGKSSLFNALARMEIAQVGARRPLTTLPMACVWGEDGSQELLEWLGVPAERRVRRESVLDADRQASLNGLVLLDLPDHDSTEVVHRVEVDRLITMVDLLVWVVDPQKYADDALHSGYLQRMTGHDSVMVVVLNQIDKLSPDEAFACGRDLRRLLDGDGLESVRLVPVSATRGDGVDEFRQLLADVVATSSVIEERLAADLDAAGGELAQGLARVEPGEGEPLGIDRLVDQLMAATGTAPVVEAISTEYRRRGSIRTGWPVLRWISRLSPDALGRLGSTLAARDLRVIATSLSPVTAPSQRAQVELAVEATIAVNADPLPQRWAQAVRDAVGPSAGSRPGLVSTLDETVASVDLQSARPFWWRAVALAQFGFSLAAAVGVLWLFVIGAGQLVGRQLPKPPSVAGLALPLLLLVLGLVAGAVLAGLSRWALRVGAMRRQQAARAALSSAIREVAENQVVAPIRQVLARHRTTRFVLAGDGVRPSAVVEAVATAGAGAGEVDGRTIAGSADAGGSFEGSRAPESSDFAGAQPVQSLVGAEPTQSLVGAEPTQSLVGQSPAAEPDAGQTKMAVEVSAVDLTVTDVATSGEGPGRAEAPVKVQPASDAEAEPESGSHALV